MGEVLLRTDKVIAKTGLSRSAIYATRNFPKSVKIGERAVAWVESEVDAWIDSTIAASRTNAVQQ
jgi:prophage regulatory protein